MLCFDFDSTIVFSETYGIDNTMLYTCKSTKQLLYSTNTTIDLLNSISHAGIELVLVTARKFKDINTFNIFKEINVKYYICSLGYEIYVNNKLDEDWATHCKNKEKNLDVNKVIHILEKYNSFISRLKIISSGYIHVSLDKQLTKTELSEIELKLYECGYSLKYNSKVLKILSIDINKGQAVKYLKNKYLLTTSKIYGIGDDLIDLDFLNICDYALVPKNSNLYYLNKFKSTNNSGILSTNEMLSCILEDILNK